LVDFAPSVPFVAALRLETRGERLEAAPRRKF